MEGGGGRSSVRRFSLYLKLFRILDFQGNNCSYILVKEFDFMFDILKLAIEFISIFAKFTSSRKFHFIYYEGIREVYIKLSYVHIFKMQCKEF